MGRWLVVVAVAVLGACGADDGGPGEDAGYPATDGHRESRWEANCGADLCGEAWCYVRRCMDESNAERELCMRLAGDLYRSEDRLGVLPRCLNPIQSDSQDCSSYWTGARSCTP